MELGIIPRNPHEYVDLLDDSVSNEEKRKRVMGIYNSEYSASCAYCNGLSSDTKRYPPAEQFTTEELIRIRKQGKSY
jgi:thioredoxin-related protein